MLMYKMEFPIRERVATDGDLAQHDVSEAQLSVCSADGRVYVECSGVALIMTPTQAKDLMFSLRKAVYEAQRETRSTKRYQNQYQKGGVQ